MCQSFYLKIKYLLNNTLFLFFSISKKKIKIIVQFYLLQFLFSASLHFRQSFGDCFILSLHLSRFSIQYFLFFFLYLLGAWTIFDLFFTLGRINSTCSCFLIDIIVSLLVISRKLLNYFNLVALNFSATETDLKNRLENVLENFLFRINILL